MNRLPLSASLSRTMLGLAAVVLGAVATPAHAVNDWYKMGYSEGYLRQEQICQQQIRQQVQARFEQIQNENQRLRQELARLREQVEVHATGAAAPLPVQQAAAGQPYFEYPAHANPQAVRDDVRLSNAASVGGDDDNDSGG